MSLINDTSDWISQKSHLKPAGIGGEEGGGEGGGGGTSTLRTACSSFRNMHNYFGVR